MHQLVFRPLSRIGEFPTDGEDLIDVRLSVSGPSRGMGGVPHKEEACTCKPEKVSGPSRGLGWVLPDFIGFVAWGATAFPAPLEDWVVSYKQ